MNEPPPVSVDELPPALVDEPPSGFDGRFRTLFEERWESLFRYLQRLTGDADGAADVAQECFMRLYRRGEIPADTGAWLASVAHNLLRDAGRRRRRRRELRAAWLTAMPVPSSPPDPEALVEQTEREARVRALLATLPERQRQVLLLRAEGMKYREIATVLGIPTTSVGQTLARALKAFRRAHLEGGHAPHRR